MDGTMHQQHAIGTGHGGGHLPAPCADPASPMGVDANINMDTIDNYLGLPGVVYRDARMLFDPADFSQVGGSSELESMVEGFKLVPYPYLATLAPGSLENQYAGPSLYRLNWHEDGSIATAQPCYEESELILRDLFPQDAPIFLMCGIGGYSGLTRSLLIHLGWDARLLYNVGGGWSYKGNHRKELIMRGAGADGHDIYALWRADVALIDFGRLHPLA